MRKILIAVFATILFLGVTPNTQAQGFEKGKVYLDLGVGAPRYSYNTFYNYNTSPTRTPSFRASVRYGFNEFISGGLYAGFTQHRRSYTHPSFQGVEFFHRTQYIPVGVGASFHVWSFLNNTLDLGLGVENLDLYVTLTTGAQIRAEVEKKPIYTYPYTTTYTNSYTRVSPFFGSMVGGRYFFLDWMGAYVQFGYGMNSYVEGGLTFKF